MYGMRCVVCGMSGCMVLIGYTTIQKLKKQLDGPEWGTRGKDWEFGIIRGKLLYIKWIHNKVRLYSMRNLYSISCNKP